MGKQNMKKTKSELPIKQAADDENVEIDDLEKNRSDLNKIPIQSEVNARVTLTKKIAFDYKIIVALIILIGTIFTVTGTIIVALINGRYNMEPTRMIIAATGTAEANATQAVYMAATITAAANQNLDNVELSISLPGGHTPPDSIGNISPNIDKNLANRIQIPTLNVDAPVVQGDGWDELKKGVGQKTGTAYPGEKGVIILSAYNDIYGELFRYLDQLKPDDKIVLFTADSKYYYTVENYEIVSSQNLNLVVNPNKSNLILTSQYPYLQDNQWVVVYAVLDN
jgi:LPXTG-site transpeptidase (sortase) family protein